MGVTGCVPKHFRLQMDYKYAAYITYFGPVFVAAPPFVGPTLMSTILPVSLDNSGLIWKLCIL